MTTRRSPQLFRNRRRGALTVEFALTVPILFLFVLGAVELSRANMIRNSAENAAYEAARRGIIPGASADAARQEAQTVLRAVGIRNATINVSPAVILPDTPQITVTVDVPMNSNGLIVPRYLRDQSITRSITLNREMLEFIPDPGNVPAGGTAVTDPQPQPGTPQSQARRQRLQQLLAQWYQGSIPQNLAGRANRGRWGGRARARGRGGRGHGRP